MGAVTHRENEGSGGDKGSESRSQMKWRKRMSAGLKLCLFYRDGIGWGLGMHVKKEFWSGETKAEERSI